MISRDPHDQKGVRLINTAPHELTERALNGDPAAFVSLLQPHKDSLRALAYTVVRDPDLLDDIMQDAFAKAFRSIRQLRDAPSFKSWIHRIVYTTAIDEVRRRRSVVPMEAGTMPERTEPRTSLASQAATKYDINTALWHLPPQQRAAVFLIDAHGFDYASAADILRVPPGTVASRVAAARAALRRLLNTSERDSDQ